jgi:hypothetical protein
MRQFPVGPAGVAIAGGESNDAFNIALNESRPGPASNSWVIDVTNFSSSLGHSWTPYVTCAS